MTVSADEPIDINLLLEQRSSLKALAMGLLKDEGRAEDVVQDTYLTALERPPRPGGSFPAWLAK